MKLHANARTCPRSRQEIVRRFLAGKSRECLSEEFAVSTRTISKWVARYRAEGEAGLIDRSSAPRRVRRTDPGRVDAVLALRRLRFSGPEIAELLELPGSTTSALLKRHGLGRLGRVGLEPAQRYERERPGELIHVDVKKLGRIVGGAGHRVTGTRRKNRSITVAPGIRRDIVRWEFVHIAIDDCTRLAYAEVLPDETGRTAAAFLRRAIVFFGRHGITVERLLTDNGSPYRSVIHALCCRQLGIRHLRTRPRRPQTNGKAERFIRTMIDGWAYGAIYASSTDRTAALDGWLWHYNHRRRHQAIGRQPPIQRLNNLLGSYN